MMTLRQQLASAVILLALFIGWMVVMPNPGGM